MNLDEAKKLISNYTCMSTCSSFGFVFIRERYFVMSSFPLFAARARLVFSRVKKTKKQTVCKACKQVNPVIAILRREALAFTKASSFPII